MRLAWLLAALLAASGVQAKCLLPAQKPMVEAELLFGRDIPGGGTVSDEAWADFATTAITQEFPDGFTVSDAEGTWRDAANGAAVHERSKIVLIDGRATPVFARKLKRVAELYRARFRQDAVGIVTREVCAAF